jgi:hypothetical protein
VEYQVRISLIDIRLGKREDNADEQLLGAWSFRPDQSANEALDIVRLARGSIGLCSHFSKVKML